MHAAVLHEFGPARNLRYETVPDPEPGPEQVRIAVAAAGVHLIDTGVRAGDTSGPGALPDLPFVGGREVAGVVDRVGPGGDPGLTGRRVVAYLGPAGAAWAELTVARTTSLHLLPEGVDDAEAVAMIGTGRTAYGVLEWAAPSADDVVLVTSAAGGMGAILVQACLAVGATVVGAAGGPSKVERVRALGGSQATRLHAVDYDAPDWAGTVRDQGLGEVTLVLDAIGGERGRAALSLLGPGGRFLIYGWSSGEPTQLGTADVLGRQITVSAGIGPRLMRRPGGFRDLETAALAALAEGRVRPLTTTFPLSDAAGAHAALEGRRTVGKLVLTP